MLIQALLDLKAFSETKNVKLCQKIYAQSLGITESTSVSPDQGPYVMHRAELCQEGEQQGQSVIAVFFGCSEPALDGNAVVNLAWLELGKKLITAT